MAIKNLDFKDVLFYMYSCLLSIMVVLIEDPLAILWIYIAYMLFLMALVRLNLTHPFVWFIPFFILYYCSDVILSLFSGNLIAQESLDTLKIAWFSLVIISSIINLNIVSYENLKNKTFQIESANLNIIWVTTLLFCSLSLFQIIQSGAINKRQMYLNSQESINLSIFFNLLIIVYSAILIKKVLDNKVFPWIFVTINSVFIIISFLINGERNIVLTLFLVTMLIYNTIYRKISKTSITIVGLLGLISIPIMQNLKNYLVTLQVNDTFSGNIIVDIIQSEFSSAAKNFKIIYTNHDDFFYGKTLLWDIGRTFSGNYDSPTAWFNNLYFPNVVKTGGGRGFSILAEGYINFGILGTLLWAVLLGTIIRFIYRKSSNNYFLFITYLCILPTMIYILRADYAFLLSNSIKQVVIPLFVLYIFSKIRVMRKV